MGGHRSDCPCTCNSYQQEIEVLYSIFFFTLLRKVFFNS